MNSGLYGIYNSNRSLEDHWGKNSFNSSFPTSLASFMADNNIPAIYVYLDFVDGKPTVVSDEILISDVFQLSKTRSLKETYFSFESRFEPYQKYSFDRIDGIDLVVKDLKGQFITPLEVKLTVLPTSQTSVLPESQWGCELVIRSATTSYTALGMYDSIVKNSSNINKVRDIFESSCSSIETWNNTFEVSHKMSALTKSLDTFQSEFYQLQKPILMQTIWKTQGKSPILADNAFDIVIWSDYAFSRLFIDSSYNNQKTVSRPMRATARLTRALWELSKSNKISLKNIYRQMAFGSQTDKEFAINGSKWRRYVSSDRITKPILSRDVISSLMDPRSFELLSPERRFDQTLYFTLLNKS